MRLYTQKDFVDVVDENGEPLPAVPKAWLGTDKVDPGVTKVGKSSKSDKSQPSTTAADIPDGDPSADWKVAQIEAYAQREGIDLTGASNKAEKLAAVAKTEPVTGD